MFALEQVLAPTAIKQNKERDKALDETATQVRLFSRICAMKRVEGQRISDPCQTPRKPPSDSTQNGIRV